MLKLPSADVHSFERIAIFVALAILPLSARASADPLLVTGGSFHFSWEGSAGVEVSGPHFMIRFADSNPEEFGVPGLAIEHADPYAATYPLGGHILPNANGRLTLLDGSLPDDYYTLQFDLSFDAGSAAVQTGVGTCFSGECPRTFATGPFQLSGDFTTFSGEIGSRFPVQRTLVGHGLATVGFLFPAGEAPRPYAIYDFDAAATTPEPATLLLMATALMTGYRRTPRSAVPIAAFFPRRLRASWRRCPRSQRA